MNNGDKMIEVWEIALRWSNDWITNDQAIRSVQEVLDRA